MPKSKPDFERASESLDQRKARLQAQAKQLDDALRKYPTPRPQLVPKGAMRARGDNYARAVVTNKRINVQRDLDKAREQIKARDERVKAVKKTKELGR